MNAIDERIGDRIRRVRKFRKMTVTELGRRVGMHVAVMSKLETGQRGVSVGEAVALAEALDVPLDLLTSDGPLVMSVEV